MARPWDRSYPPGLAWDTPIATGFVPDLLRDAARDFGEHPALDFMGRKITYREFEELSDRFAFGLQGIGVGPGVHVGLYLPNSPHYPIAFFGILKAGGVVVNYSPLDAGVTLEHKIHDSETEIMITLDLAALYPQMAHLLAATPLRTLVVGTLAEMSGNPEAVGTTLRETGALTPVAWDAGHVAFESLLRNDGRYVRHDAGDPREALAVLQYTGGTTGLPKGAIITHGNLTSAANAMWLTAQTDPPILEQGRERLLAVLPPFHIYALAVNMLMGIRLAAEVVLHVRFDIPTVVKDIAEKRIGVFCGVPTMFVALLNTPLGDKLDLSSLRLCNSGGAPLPVPVREAFAKLTGCWVGEGWGMTETSAAGTFTSPRGASKPGSCGVPFPGCTIRFAALDDPARSVPLGEKGEICISGPNVMKGYWKQPAATAEAFTPDGFLRTGDVGYMDADGFVFIVDRTKDMLLCGGFNVYPRFIEEAIYQHPAVAECAVIGIPDEYRGQSPKAYIALKPGAAPLSLADLKEFLSERVGKHEMVHALELCDALPKTPVGKISKKDLYDREADFVTAATPS
jgi:long-chain acyl-CoA synthetase